MNKLMISALIQENSLEADTSINQDTHLYGFAQFAQGKPFNPERNADNGLAYEHDLNEKKRFFLVSSIMII